MSDLRSIQAKEETMQISRRQIVSIAALVGLNFSLMTGASAQDMMKFDLANAFPESTLPAQSEKNFVKLVEEKSDGSVIITPHFGAALGYEGREQFSAVRDGAVALASAPFDKYVGFAPIFALQSMPFLTPTIEKTKTLFDIARPYYEKAFNEANQTLLLGEPWTPQGIWAKKRITGVDDIKGLKVRSYDATGTRVLKRAGASPIQLSGGDVVPALSTNTIEAVLTSDESGVSGRYWEHDVKYFNFLGYTMGISAVTMNLDSYNSLSDDQKSALRAAAEEAEAAAWEIVRERVAQNKNTMSENGAEYFDQVPQEVINHLKDAGSSELDKWREDMGAETADEILAKFNDMSN